jgi:Zn-dependent M28 family amino/carboxypeptidase
MIVGGIPVVRRGQTGGMSALLQSKGVAGILTVSAVYPRTSSSSRKGNATINLYKRNIAPQQYSISEKVARAIIGNDYDGVKKDSVIVKTYTSNILLGVQKTTITNQSSNVMGLLPGTDLKDEYLFITAHYDHLGKRGDSVIYYGADDDGSGTVSVLELAEAFTKAKAAGKGPRRSIVFMTVSGEEKGLWGSEYYSNNPVYPLDKTTADLNIDMIGRSDSSRKGDTTNYIYVVGDDKLSSDLKTISEAVNKKYTKLELDYKFNDPNDKNFIYYRSDHYNFAKKGVPIIFYYDGMLGSDYHRPTDTPEKIHYPLMAKRAQLVFYTAWEMANRNEMLKRDIPLDNSIFNR